LCYRSSTYFFAAESELVLLSRTVRDPSSKLHDAAYARPEASKGRKADILMATLT
jgi:hypothetical protein